MLGNNVNRLSEECKYEVPSIRRSVEASAKDIGLRSAISKFGRHRQFIGQSNPIAEEQKNDAQQKSMQPLLKNNDSNRSSLEQLSDCSGEVPCEMEGEESGNSEKNY